MVRELNVKEMNIEEAKRAFEDFVKSAIINVLPERYAGQKPKIETVQKNNQEMTGVIVTLPGSNIAPTIYLEPFFKQFMADEATLDEILQQIAKMIVDNEIQDEIDVESLLAWEIAKDKVVPRLYDVSNEKLLENTVSRNFLDMAITYAVEFQAFDDSMGSIRVTKNLLQMWNISEDELHSQAMKNLEEQGHVITSMMEVMMELMGGELPIDMPDMEDQMYILTNSKKMNGCNALLNTSVMEEAIEKVGKDFYILPSSVHEVLLVRAGSGHDEESLKEMVMGVNATEVAPQDKLTDSVYRYVGGKVIKVA